MNRMGMLSIRDVINYNYCPRIIFFEYILKRPQARTVKEDVGLKAHNNFVPRAKRNKMVKTKYDKKFFNLPLFSKKFNLQTVVDCVLVNTYEKIAIPMQFKHGRPPPYLYRTMKYQLVAEAMLIEEELGFRCPYGLVKFIPEDKTIRLDIGFREKEEIKKQIGEIYRVIMQEYFPIGSRTKNYCRDCCYYEKICSGCSEAI